MIIDTIFWFDILCVIWNLLQQSYSYTDTSTIAVFDTTPNISLLSRRSRSSEGRKLWKIKKVVTLRLFSTFARYNNNMKKKPPHTTHQKFTNTIHSHNQPSTQSHSFWAGCHCGCAHCAEDTLHERQRRWCRAVVGGKVDWLVAWLWWGSALR